MWNAENCHDVIVFGLICVTKTLDNSIMKHFDGKMLNSLPNNNVLDESRLIAFADNKMNMTEKLKLFWEA